VRITGVRPAAPAVVRYPTPVSGTPHRPTTGRGQRSRWGQRIQSRSHRSGRRAAFVEWAKQLGPGLDAGSRSPQTAQYRSIADIFRTGRRVVLPGRDPETTVPSVRPAAPPTRPRTDHDTLG